MATFTNQASLTYNGITANSNIVTGEITELLTARKTAVEDDYTTDDVLTYVVSIQNTGATPTTALTITDDLGAYAFGATTLTPLTYTGEDVLFYINGALQATPTVTAGPPLTISGITIPAGAGAVIVYRARVNNTAPLGEASSIVNTATITGAGLINPVTADATVSNTAEPRLSILKSLSPTTLVDNGQLTYTFTIVNDGSAEADAAANIVINDTFDPILSGITVNINGTPVALGTAYTYDEGTGEFATVAGQVTVPAATYAQDPTTGVWSITPGVATVTVTGTV